MGDRKYLISEESLRYLLPLAARKAYAANWHVVKGVSELEMAEKIGRDFDLRDLMPYSDSSDLRPTRPEPLSGVSHEQPDDSAGEATCG